MASEAQAQAKMREICLALPNTTEGDHFGKTAYYVKKKLFAAIGLEGGAFSITFGLPPEDAKALVKRDPRFTQYPRDARAVVIAVKDVKGWGELKEFLAASHALRAGPAKKAAAKKTARPTNKVGGKLARR